VRSLTRTPSGSPPTEAQAVVGLVLNLCIPGAGSLVAGKPGPGVAQLAMLIAGLPLCFVIVGFPIVFAAWLWALMTGVQAMQEAKGLSGPQ
jgi:TM2 domain-containing membrane protein YozV